MSYQTSYDPVSMLWSLSDGSHYLELPEWARELLIDEHERETKQLKAENDKLRGQYETVIADYRSEVAKLRELVRDMWREGMCECDERGACAECEYHFPDRMRELGVEDG